MSDEKKRADYQKTVMQGGGTPESERKLNVMVEAAINFQKVDILVKRRHYDEAIEICDNAMAVANYLDQHDRVEWVSYGGLPDSKYYDLAQKYTNGKPSALLTFGIKGGFDAGVRFYDALNLFLRLVNIGDTKSLAAHPASTTHRQLSGEELAAAGVTPDMIRLCIGIEHIDDIIADLDQALVASA